MQPVAIDCVAQNKGGSPRVEEQNTIRSDELFGDQTKSYALKLRGKMLAGFWQGLMPKYRCEQGKLGKLGLCHSFNS